jgi:hypothetical protein
VRCLVVICAGLAALVGASAARAQSSAGTPTSAGTQATPAATTSSSPTPAAPPATAPDSTALSDPSTGGALAMARAAFQEGTLLAKQARWVDALEAFERADALHPHAITTYNIGYCERLLGHWTRARKMLQKALADHKARGEVELPPDLVSATQTYLTEAEHQIARVLVTVVGQGGAVAVDGRPLELAPAGGPSPALLAGTRGIGPAEATPASTFEVQVDPGEHVFVLSTKGRADVATTETLAPGAQVALELRAPVPEAPRVSGEATSGSEGASAGPPNHVPAFVAFGIGAVGLVTGSVSGLIAFGKKSAVSNACGPSGSATDCTSEGDAGNRAADIATTGFIVGGVGVAVGAVLFLTAPGGGSGKVATAPSSRSNVRPWVGWRSLGVQGDF